MTAATPDSVSATVPVTVAVAVNSVEPSVGDESVRTGPVLSMLTVADPITVFPALSNARPVTVCAAPSVEITSSSGHTITPEPASAQVKCAVTSVLFQPAALGGGLSMTVTAGGVTSMSNGSLVTDATLPALSVTVPVTVWLAPSDATVLSGGHVSTPDPASLHVKCAVTGVFSHPPGAGVNATVIAGSVRSMLNAALVTDAELPALSVAVSLTVWPAPSFVTVLSAGQAGTPDPPSAQSKWTTTGPLFHPFAFAAGDTVAVTTGAILSRFTVRLATAVLPALSTAVPDTICCAPSVLTSTGAGHAAMPDSSSAHVKVTVTSALFQPAVFAGGFAAAEIRGAMTSVVTTSIVR